MSTPVEILSEAFSTLTALGATRDAAKLACDGAAASMDVAIGPERATFQAAGSTYETASAVFRGALDQAKLDIGFAAFETTLAEAQVAYQSGVIDFAAAVELFRYS
jgi:hypothetical protein